MTAFTCVYSVARRVILKKGASGLGFDIVCSEEDKGIFVSSVVPGGPADVSRELRKGDQLILVSVVTLYFLLFIDVH